MTCALCSTPTTRASGMCYHCDRAQQKKARTVQRRLERARRLMAGVELVARGGRYADAANAAGYSDPFTFSNACLRHLGARPRVLAREIRRT